MTTTAKVYNVSVTDVQKVFTNLFTEVEAATGVGCRQRFNGFNLMQDLKTLIEKGMSLLEDGDLDGAMKTVRNAKNWLWNSERKFCVNSMDDLDRKIGKLLVEPDLFARVSEARKAFEAEVNRVKDPKTADLVKASTLHWALYETIESADNEQTERVRVKVAERAAERKAKRDLLEVRREANRKVAEEVKATLRVSVAHTLAEQFAAILGGRSGTSHTPPAQQSVQ